MKINRKSEDKKSNRSSEISNNFLVVLIIATILSTVIGTWISLSKLSPLTGLVPAPGIGLVNVTVNASVAFNITPQSVNFTGLNPGDIDGTTDNSPLPFNLTNEGTVLINVTVSSSAALFREAALNLSNFQIACGNSTIDGNCSQNTVAAPNPNFSTVLPNFINVTSTAQRIIGMHNFHSSNDTVQVHINVTVPTNEPSGLREVTLTFVASQGS